MKNINSFFKIDTVIYSRRVSVNHRYVVDTAYYFFLLGIKTYYYVYGVNTKFCYQFISLFILIAVFKFFASVFYLFLFLRGNV